MLNGRNRDVCCRCAYYERSFKGSFCVMGGMKLERDYEFCLFGGRFHELADDGIPEWCVCKLEHIVI